MKSRPLTKDKSQSISVLYELTTSIKSGINPFGWYHTEDIISAINYLKDLLGNECDKEIDEAFPLVNQNDREKTVRGFEK